MKIFTLLILLLLLPVSAWAEATKESVSYIECSWDGSKVTSSTKTATATVVTEGVTEWGENGQEHWYVVNEEINIPSRVTVTGHVHLILADGCKLTASNGIEVFAGYSLTIYAQSTDENTMGKLTAKGADYNAGIGGSFRNANSGTVTIHGGTVNATSNSGAGIGGGRGDHIYGGFGSFSTGTNGNAFIIASRIQDNSEEKKESWSGVLFEGDAGAVYGSPTLQTDATIPADKTLTIENGKTLTIGEGVTLTVKEGATLTVEGTLTNNGTVENNGRIVNKGGTINGVTNYLNPVDLDENMVSLEATPFTYTGDAIEPEVTVSNGNVTYIKGTDYTVSYSDNNIVGTAKVTVTPIDSDQSALLGAAVEKTFTIEKAPATLSFAKETVSATIGETVENTLTVNPAGVAVSYSSSDEKVATVDASTGAITLVGAGETTITATVADPNYQGEAASYTLTVTLAPLGEGEITAEGETNISIEMDGTSFELTAKVIADDLGTNGTWTWASGNTNVATVSVKGDAASGYSLRATTDPKTSTAIVTPVAAGTATITATYTDSEYTGSVDFTVTITEPEPEEPKPPIYQPSYYNIYVEDVCEGVDITTSKNVVREGGTISLYVEKDTANYTFDNFKVYYKRSYYGGWEELKEGTQPGEYPVNNIWTHIYIKAEGAEEKEDPTGIEQIEGVKVYTKDGSLYVQTPQREQVIIVSMSGAIVKNEEQIGLKQYHGLQPGIYIVRVGDKAYKLRLH